MIKIKFHIVMHKLFLPLNFFLEFMLIIMDDLKQVRLLTFGEQDVAQR